MEPNPLASYNAPGSTADRSVRLDDAPAVHVTEKRLTHDGGTARGADAGLMAAPGFAPVVTTSNGHSLSAPAARHLNGHSNGDSGWGTLTLQSLAGATYAPGLPAAETNHHTFYIRIGKRWLDCLGAGVGLVLGAPLLALVAVCIKLESHGPVLYKSKRVGRGGRSFTFFKLRSMVNGADQNRDQLSHLNESDGPVFKIARDPRVTRIGRFLRTTSIDELPQLFNVLRGDMSLVGPRPPIAEEVAQYEPWQFRRLEVRPGLTCLWQISGRSRIGFQEWMRLDLEYIRKQSFWLDVKILIRTIPAVLSREGAY